MLFALGVLPGRPLLVKFGWPITTSAFWLLVVGIWFQMRTRLSSVSATTRCMPSEATPWGFRRLFCVAEVLVVVVTKSGWPSTTEAVPTHTGHLLL